MDIITIILIVAVVILLALVVFLLVRVSGLERRVRTFTKGREGASLESEIKGLFRDNKHLMKNGSRNKRDIEEIKMRMSSHVCKVGIIKYDAFHQMGGQLSFALCMLDEEDNGFVLNSVQSADGCYSYIKEITAGVSAIELGREEQQAFSEALRPRD
ncbi:MAG: DUF4446 family protein [Lachnospiraceae bacterium]|nr:DUF4446 family protein [Lachnospiraceae bacterium]MBQ6903357.1 DUF4446 family protein [Lachnospiraceae bacterium]